MKVLIINCVCGIRSTGRICTDLAKELEDEGCEVKIAYGRENVPKQYKKYAVRIGTGVDVILHGVKARLMDADGQGSKHATKVFIEWVKEYDPDVINLHNIHGYYINVPLLFKYIAENNKKVIWTFHDMWPITGHSGTCDIKKCEKWKTGCNNCPMYKEYPASFLDRSNRNYELKKNIFTSIKNLTIVTPSHWLENIVKKSFLGKKSIVVIPNGVDIASFRPIDNNFKSNYGIENKIIIMGCATWWGTEKGLDDFCLLASRLDPKYKIVLVGLNKKQIDNLPHEILGVRRTNSVKELVQIYSAADIFVNLTYADNYPTVNLEALACGTPVITYETGGSAECLDGRNGIAFPRGNIDDVVNFLNNKYEDGFFTVKEQKKIDKQTSASEFFFKLIREK